MRPGRDRLCGGRRTDGTCLLGLVRNYWWLMRGSSQLVREQMVESMLGYWPLMKTPFWGSRC
jgi:hypothetical protein